MPSTEKILYTRAEAANMLSMSLSSIDRYIATKELTARRKGRKVLLQHVELMKFSRKDTV